MGRLAAVRAVVETYFTKADPGMYICRRVLNDGAIQRWAREQGLPPLDPDLHVTIAHSTVGVPVKCRHRPTYAWAAGIERLGKDGAIVVMLQAPELEARWQLLRDRGATWDFRGGYKPHMTLFYDEDAPDSVLDVDWQSMPSLELGPELVGTLDEDVFTKRAEKWPAGTPGGRGGQWRPKDSKNGVSMLDGQWRGKDGPVDEATAKRIKSLGISPGYRNVRLNPDHTADLQGVGVDSKGRTKRFYRPGFADVGKQIKYARNEAFHKARPKLMATAEKDAEDAELPGRERDAAAVLLLIDRTGFRPGSERDRGADVQAYGATTLRAEHVKLKGTTASFSFVGKNGKTITKELNDPTVTKLLKTRLAGKQPGDRVFEASDGDLRHYMDKRGFGDFMPKDLRTWNGTNRALQEIETMAPPTSAREFKRAQKAVATKVAAHLGNTPSVALASYINPRVWDRWGFAP